MKAVVRHGVGDIRVDDVPDPQIQAPTDAIVRLTASALCGTDLHFVRGSMAGMKPGTILGHEGVGVVEEVGEDVRNLEAGDRVVICSTIGCGVCTYCRAGYYAQCDNANPDGPSAGTAFFGGPEAAGAFDGLQAERARILYAHTTCVKLPDEVADDDAILLSDIFPTAWFGARLAEITDGDSVAVFGCGPVGLFGILSAQLQGVGRVFAVDQLPSRLQHARRLGAEVVDFSREEPVETLKRLTGGSGPDRVIDAVGVDAESPGAERSEDFAQEVKEVAPETPGQGSPIRRPGDAPSQALRWEGRGGRQGRDPRDHRRLPAAGRALPDRGRDEQEPHRQGRQLQPPPLRPRARRARAHRRRAALRPPGDRPRVDGRASRSPPPAPPG